MKRINQFLLEKFALKYPKNTWVDISGTREEFADVQAEYEMTKFKIIIK